MTAHLVTPALILGDEWEVFRTPIGATAVYENGGQATIVEFTDANKVNVVKLGELCPIDEDGCAVIARAIINCKEGWNMDTAEIDPDDPHSHWSGESALLPISFDKEDLNVEGVSFRFAALVALVYAWHGQDRESIEVTGSDEDGYEYRFNLGTRWYISVSPNMGLNFIKVIPK